MLLEEAAAGHQRLPGLDVKMKVPPNVCRDFLILFSSCFFTYEHRVQTHSSHYFFQFRIHRLGYHSNGAIVQTEHVNSAESSLHTTVNGRINGLIYGQRKKIEGECSKIL